MRRASVNNGMGYRGVFMGVIPPMDSYTFRLLFPAVEGTACINHWMAGLPRGYLVGTFISGGGIW